MTLHCCGNANKSTILATPFHGSVLSAGFFPRGYTLLPASRCIKGILEDPYDEAHWHPSPSAVRFEANTLYSPKRASALFSLLTLPRDSTEEILSEDDQNRIHVDANVNPFFRDQLTCNYFFKG